MEMSKVECDARELMARMSYDQKELLFALMEGADVAMLPEVFMMADGVARECEAVDFEVYANSGYRRLKGAQGTDAEAVEVLDSLQELVLGTRSSLNVGEYMVFDSVREAPEHHLTIRKDMARELGMLLCRFGVDEGLDEVVNEESAWWVRGLPVMFNYFNYLRDVYPVL
ncbi:MAG: hypothetical protein HDT09_02045 [Bacteroidales bacterium]|nr:hypothetical protein [Bacteroidales bacterium]